MCTIQTKHSCRADIWSTTFHWQLVGAPCRCWNCQDVVEGPRHLWIHTLLPAFWELVSGALQWGFMNSEAEPENDRHTVHRGRQSMFCDFCGRDERCLGLSCGNSWPNPGTRSKALSTKKGFYEPLTHSIASNEYHMAMFGLAQNILVFFPKPILSDGFHSSGPSTVLVERFFAGSSATVIPSMKSF